MTRTWKARKQSTTPAGVLATDKAWLPTFDGDIGDDDEEEEEEELVMALVEEKEGSRSQTLYNMAQAYSRAVARPNGGSLIKNSNRYTRLRRM